jgi:acetyl esterase/lipase
MPMFCEANDSTARRRSSVPRLLATGALTLLAVGIIAGCAATAPAATATPDSAAAVPTTVAAEPAAPVGRGAPDGGMAAIKATPTVKDVAYASASPTQKLDLYLPEGAGPFPLILNVHGGGFMMGDKSNPPGADEFLANGYAVASVDYRLSGEALAPAQIEDIKAAVRFLRANADKYKLNSDKFAGFGGSAGGSLVALLGTSCGAAALEGADLGNADQSSCVQAVVDWFGPIEFLQMDKQFAGTSCPANHDQADSPESKLVGAPIQTVPDKVKLVNAITYVSPKAPPFLIQHGTADCNVPPQQGQLLYDALKPAIGADKVTLTFLEGAGHGGAQFSDAANMKLVLDFLAKYLKG